MEIQNQKGLLLVLSFPSFWSCSRALNLCGTATNYMLSSLFIHKTVSNYILFFICSSRGRERKPKTLSLKLSKQY
uniref:Uncharacterized protein n=1 Tax=Rhizophora mucronata TaxID=61149 RepID=A0A2P2QYF6_RHIMU